MSGIRTPEQLAALVKVMREKGVLECDGVKLGPDPKDIERHEKETDKQRAEREAIRHRDTMYAASSIKPKLKFPK